MSSMRTVVMDHYRTHHSSYNQHIIISSVRRRNKEKCRKKREENNNGNDVKGTNSNYYYQQQYNEKRVLSYIYIKKPLFDDLLVGAVYSSLSTSFQPKQFPKAVRQDLQVQNVFSKFLACLSPDNDHNHFLLSPSLLFFFIKDQHTMKYNLRQDETDFS